MNLPGWVAAPADGQARLIISQSTLWHFTKPRYAEKILKGPIAGSNRSQVHLMASQGWSFNPTKLIRDWSVWDKDFSSQDYARYLYFFLDEPNQAERKFLAFQGITSSIRVEGSDLLDLCGDRLFFRRTDKAVVIRGDYVGPGVVSIVAENA